MKKLLITASLMTITFNVTANDNLQPIEDGPPQILAENAAVVLDADVKSKTSSNDAVQPSTKIDETRRRGTGINEIRVKYKALPSYELRQEIGERKGERSHSDIESETSIPQWQIGSW